MKLVITKKSEYKDQKDINTHMLVLKNFDVEDD
jgi:hypothetical protein